MPGALPIRKKRSLFRVLAGHVVALASTLFFVGAQANTPQTLLERANAALHLDPETSLAFSCRYGSVNARASSKTTTDGLCVFNKPNRQFHFVSDTPDTLQPLTFTLMPEQIVSFGQTVIRDGIFVRSPVDQIQIRISGLTYFADLPRREAFALTDAMDAAGFVRQEGLKAIRPDAPALPTAQVWPRSYYPPHFVPYGYPPYRHFYFRNW